MAKLNFYCDNKKIAFRSAETVPRVGDLVRFNKKIYKVDTVVFCYDEDEYLEIINIGISEERS